MLRSDSWTARISWPRRRCIHCTRVIAFGAESPYHDYCLGCYTDRLHRTPQEADMMHLTFATFPLAVAAGWEVLSRLGDGDLLMRRTRPGAESPHRYELCIVTIRGRAA